MIQKDEKKSASKCVETNKQKSLPHSDVTKGAATSRRPVGQPFAAAPFSFGSCDKVSVSSRNLKAFLLGAINKGLKIDSA